MRYTLRDDQVSLVDDLRRAVSDLREAGQDAPKVIACAPTGAGKTVLAADMMERAASKGKKTLFLAPRRELILQACNKLTDFSVDHGVIMAGSRPRPLATTHVVSKDTLHSRCIKRKVMAPPQADLVFVDECHLSMAPTFQEVFGLWPNATFIGLSATPARADGIGLGDYWHKLIQGPTYESLIAKGALAPTRIFAPYTPDMKGVRTTAGDYNSKDREAKMDKAKLVGDIVDTWRLRAQDRYTICFASGIQHSLHIRDQFRKAGISAEHVDGTMPNQERDHILAKFRRGEFKILCNCMVCSYGFDAPLASCCILARPTKSLVLYRQMSGRVQRPHPDKEYALILDHSGCANVLGFPDDDIEWTLDKTVNNTQQHQDKVDKEKKRVPIICSQCKFVFPWSPETGTRCPRCRHENKKPPRMVKAEPGQLKEMVRKKRLREARTLDKQRFWDKCVHTAAYGNRKIGAAFHQYHDHFGARPSNDLKRVPRGKYEWNLLARSWLDLCRRNGE